MNIILSTGATDPNDTGYLCIYIYISSYSHTHIESERDRQTGQTWGQSGCSLTLSSHSPPSARSAATAIPKIKLSYSSDPDHYNYIYRILITLLGISLGLFN